MLTLRKCLLGDSKGMSETSSHKCGLKAPGFTTCLLTFWAFRESVESYEGEHGNKHAGLQENMVFQPTDRAKTLWVSMPTNQLIHS